MKWKALFLLLLMPVCAVAQVKINQATYWFDDNVAAAVSVTIPPDSQVNFVNNISTNTLSVGIHTFNIRFAQSNGRKSVPISSLFIKMPSGSGSGNKKIVACQYWFDNDYSGAITRQTGPAEQVQTAITVAVGALSKGAHILNMRFRDEGNSWSVTSSQLFVNRGGNGASGGNNVVTAYRYWIDTAISKAQTVYFQNPAQQTYIFKQFNFSYLDTGKHIVYYQFKDTTQTWSSVVADSFIKLGRPRIDYITPNKGGNTGDVTVSIYGTGFYEGTRVKLSKLGHADIVVPDSLINIVRGSQIIASFDLRQKDIGFYNVVVDIPKDTIMTVTKGFEIQGGKGRDVWLTFSGPEGIRQNTWQTYQVNYGNRGNVDARGVPVFIAISNATEVKLPTSVLITVNDSTFTIADTSVTIVSLDSLGNEPFPCKVYALTIANIPPGANGSLLINLKTNAPIKIVAWTSQPFYASPFNPGVGACIDDILKTGIGLFPVVGCVYGVIRAYTDPFIRTYVVHNKSTVTFNDFNSGLKDAIVGCVPGIGPAIKEYKVAAEIVKRITKAAGFYSDMGSSVDLVESCLPVFQKIAEFAKSIPLIFSSDPNSKYGPLGVGTDGYLKESNLNYAINFENQASAQNSAQSIFVIDSLSPDAFDYSTFEFNNITLGDTTLFIHTKEKNYTTYIDYRPKGNNIILKIEAGLNDTNGVVTWQFTTLDPETEQPTTNPFAGFLPPNINSPEGQGSVFFTIKTKEGLPTNTVIKNKASIYFDNNPPIVTDPWINTIDRTAPHSNVEALPEYTRDTVVPVSWNGVDTGSGIRHYTIYVSQNGNPYQIWKYQTTETSADFTGKWDSSYAFYSIATDNVGNVEEAPSTYDAITRLVRPEQDIAGGISVYPNPTSGSFTIQGRNTEAENISITITNIIGQVVLKDVIADSGNKAFKKVLDLSAQAKGYFTVTLRAGGWRQSFKIIRL